MYNKVFPYCTYSARKNAIRLWGGGCQQAKPTFIPQGLQVGAPTQAVVPFGFSMGKPTENPARSLTHSSHF